MSRDNDNEQHPVTYEHIGWAILVVVIVAIVGSAVMYWVRGNSPKVEASQSNSNCVYSLNINNQGTMKCGESVYKEVGLEGSIEGYVKIPEGQAWLSFHPDQHHFKLNTFYLGSTQAEVKNNCESKGGQLAGTKPDALVGPGLPVCVFQHDDVTDGYYPIYWPSK